MNASTKKAIRRLMLVELAGVVAAYAVYFRLHTNQDFRHTMHKRFPAILEAYYKCNEQCGICDIRKKDQIKWSNSVN
ncbi:protein CEBPZOS-like [Alligator sinensis]|uniref:Protein CEBPZOS-like n=3 Tax=Alligator TaxID=8495 RepID=A0A151MHA5_ALLMI|nr:protein CEBPZOS-like [Alligator sinensis]KYO23873.1 protein CEBPZOS-like [Alligator mississippiensis]